jgi:hypothetical protein
MEDLMRKEGSGLRHETRVYAIARLRVGTEKDDTIAADVAPK